MIHPTAEVYSSKIGSNTQIWQFVVILKDAQIGNNCNINCQVLIENDVIIGDNVTVKPGVQIWDGLRVEDNVFIGPNVTFTNDHVPRSKQYPESFAKTIIGKGASIGANSTILPGITIGRYALIGAGSVITKNIPPFSVWFGNPAVQRGYVTKESVLLDMDLKCKKSGLQYRFIEEELRPVQN
ncbi:MAG: acyltransferase [Bacteroidota bacterium]